MLGIFFCQKVLNLPIADLNSTTKNKYLQRLGIDTKNIQNEGYNKAKLNSTIDEFIKHCNELISKVNELSKTEGMKLETRFVDKI